MLVLSTLFGLYPFLQKLFADGGYQGPVFQKASAKILPHLQIDIVKRSDQAKGFEFLPRRWVVERTFGWLNRCRRLAKDFENLTRNALRGFWSEVQRVYENRICTSLPSSLSIAWNGVLKPRHFLGVRLAVRTMSWISSSDTLSISI